MTNKNLKSLEDHNAEVLSKGIQPVDKSILRNGFANNYGQPPTTGPLSNLQL